MSYTERKIQEYTAIGQVRTSGGFLGKTKRDPSVEVNELINRFIIEERHRHNQLIQETFDLPESYVKFEFYWIPPRVARVDSDPECCFRTKGNVNIICLKERSLIYFKTDYRFEVKEGCGGKGTVRAFGGKNHSQEEIYFNKISTVGTYHSEETIEIVNPGCSGSTGKYVINVDGFKIRAGENFEVIANEKFSEELAQARKMINDKISETN